MRNITIYTSNTCAHCHAVKKYLQLMSINYLEKNISEDDEAKKELIKLGFMSVPVMIIDEKSYLVQSLDMVKTLVS